MPTTVHLRPTMPAWQRYGAAFVSVGIALVPTYLFADFLAPMRLIFLWSGVLLAAIIGGTGPALLASALSIVAAALLVFAPAGSFAVHNLADVARLVLFGIFAAGISGAVGAGRQAEQRASALSRWLRTTLGSIGDAVIATDDAGIVVFMNPVAEQLTGWNSREAMEKPLDDIMRMVNEDSREPVENPVARVLASGHVVGLANHTLLVARDGTERPIDDSAAPIRDAEGHLIGVVLVFRDVAERRALERVRRQADEQTRFLNRATELLGLSLDYEQTLRTLARLCVPEIADWCAIDVVRDDGEYERLAVEHADPERVRAVLDLNRRFHPEPERDPVVAVMASGRAQLVEEITDDHLVALARDEEHLAIMRSMKVHSWMLAPMIARGRTLGTIGVVTAESGRRYTPADLPLLEELARRAALAVDNARLFTAAEAASRAKDDFLATLSHELRTPLTAILGWAGMLQMGAADGETTRVAIDTILRSARAQGELIDDLLDLSRVVAGKLALSVEPVDLVRVAEEAVTAIRPAAEGKQIALDLVAEEPVAIIRGDERRLHQVIWNLLTNAVKFTDRGGSVRVHLSTVPDRVRIDFIDTGRGIDPAFLPHVWERFRQADSSASRQHGGLGLGLSVVRHLVELHGGTVSAESEGLGRGATFTIELPRPPYALPTRTVSMEIEPPSTPSTGNETGSPS